LLQQLPLLKHILLCRVSWDASDMSLGPALTLGLSLAEKENG